MAHPNHKAKHVESRAAKMVREIFESGRPITYIRSSEEQRVARVLREVGERIGAHGFSIKKFQIRKNLFPETTSQTLP